ncbi:hypothetical protein ACFQAT_08335 [Undibacterium arcticum]|uniref:hypothetical protein n=1 Tax=Undibacterium arcticum TaxID=1762892 RepID=UPI003606037C
MKIFGCLFDSLDYRLSVEEREWRYTNRRRLELEYPRWQRTLLDLGAQPLTSAGLMFIFVTLASVLVFLFFNYVQLPVQLTIFHYPADLKPQEALAYFSALWSAQVTTVGLIYPIVLAFVALRLQRENNTKTLLHIYLHDSLALFAGLSSLLLVAEMGINLFFVPYSAVETILGITAIDGIWFAVNIGLTAFFLARTFKFIRPNEKFEILKRYAVNICWPKEARAHLANNFFRNAVEAKLLPGPTYGDEKGSSPSIFLGFPRFKLGTDEVAINLNNAGALVDVRFRLLRAATQRWKACATPSRSGYRAHTPQRIKA